MVNKLFFAGVLFFSGCLFSTAQEAEILENKVVLDGKEILKYEKLSFSQHSFYSLDDNEILMYTYNDNETPKYPEDDYLVLNFLTAKKKVETKNTTKSLSGLGLNSKKNMQKLISWLLKEKVIGPDGQLNLDRLDIFYEKYNENITERTMR